MTSARSRIVVAATLVVLLVALAFSLPATDTEAAPASGPGSASVAQSDALVSPDSGDGAGVVDARSGVSDPEPRAEFTPTVLQPGEKPPQFVVLSVDGGCETRSGVITDLLDLGQQLSGRFTFFISGLCVIPEVAKKAYRPPGKPVGRSDIGFGDEDMIAKRIEVMTRTYREGHEIGTHFLGHFCGATGVDTWNKAQWIDEIQQAKAFMDGWPIYNPSVVADRLPFDSSVIQGGRTPCLEGQRSALFPALVEEGLRYDASDPGVLKWPTKVKGGKLWEFPLPALKLSGTNSWVLAMDYNFMAMQNNTKTEADQKTCDRIRKQTADTYMEALEAARENSRAPLMLGTHLNSWVCNAYIDSLFDFALAAKAKYPDTQFISFADLTNWLEAQDPTVLKKLQALPAERDY